MRKFNDSLHLCVQMSMNKTLTQIAPRVLPPNKTHVQHPLFIVQKAPAHNSVKDTSNTATNRSTKNEQTNVEEATGEYDNLSVCASVNSTDSISSSGRVVHRPGVHCKPGPIQLGIGGEDVDDLVRRTSPSTTDSFERDIDVRATTIVSGIIQSLRPTSSITGY